MEEACLIKKKKSLQEVEAVAEPIAVEEATPVNSLRASLEAIKECDGVVGYIVRNTTSAAIDLKDPTKIIDYAILSSSALDAGKVLSELFDLGDANNIVVNGKSIKMVSLIVGESKVSVFMDRSADSEKVLRRLHEI
jgi:predicted regulator of Ras-like GTPase activity (Roadblock/LC7/MglB family)